MNAPAPDAGAAWVRERWLRLAARVASAPAPLSAWARRQLSTDAVGAGLAERHGWDAANDLDPQGGEGYDRAVHAQAREALGQVFTPRALADLLARVAGVGAEAGWATPRILDPACGDGSLLVAALRARRAAGWSVAAALAEVEGWDRDPAAAWSARATLVEWALGEGTSEALPDLAVAGGVDALSTSGRPGEVLAGTVAIGAVLSNPPYLEAKRMNRAAPGLRERLRRDFPQLSGAFDLYLAFCWRALEWLVPGGGAALLLPGKVLQARYAASFRAALCDPARAAHLEALVDLTRLCPRPFPGTSVYPAILHVVKRPVHQVRVHRVVTRQDVALPPDRWPRVALAELRRVGGEEPLFVPFDTWPALAPLFAGTRLGEVAEVASTCSFHHKGLRERFVTPERQGAPAFPYLGGPSRTRETEVAPFRVRWAGWWIRYDAGALRRTWGNPLPDLERTFLRPKAIFCQHAPRMRVFADLDGHFVTKDVYPVAWPTHPAWTLGCLVAVLQSTVFTALYNTLYQGVIVGGETYHYLPAFLKTVPVPRGDHPALSGAEARVRALQAPGGLDGDAWDDLDRRVAEAYGVAETERQRMIAVHLERVGAERPG